MTHIFDEQILKQYAHGSLWDRFHVKQRLRFFPHEVLLPHLPRTGSFLDIGCGYATVAWFLKQHRPQLDYYGADIDPTKVRVAQESLRRNRQDAWTAVVHEGVVQTWIDRPAKFRAVAILDVLLLLPLSMQRELFGFACDALEQENDAVLLLKIQPWLTGTAYLRTWIQENIMVNVLRKTRTSGALHLRQDPALYEAWADEAGFRTECVDVPTYPPSKLLVMRRT